MSNKKKKCKNCEPDDSEKQVDFENYQVPRTSIDDVTPEEWDWVAKKYFKPAQDDNVNKVVDAYLVRAEAGMNKYGTTTSKNPLDLIEWLTHAQEEAMDFTIYIQRIIEELEKSNGK